MTILVTEEQATEVTYHGGLHALPSLTPMTRVQELETENADLRRQVERLTRAVHRDGSDLYDKRTGAHDRETWRYLTNGRPAGRSGDVK